MNNDLVYTPNDFKKILEILSKKVPETNIKAIPIRNLFDNAFSEVEKFKEIEQRISYMKSQLKVDNLSYGETLTAINNGKFPSTEDLERCLYYYNNYFLNGKKQQNDRPPKGIAKGFLAVKIKKILGFPLSNEQYDKFRAEFRGSTKNISDEEILETSRKAGIISNE